jgi:hypothetical protein
VATEGHPYNDAISVYGRTSAETGADRLLQLWFEMSVGHYVIAQPKPSGFHRVDYLTRQYQFARAFFTITRSLTDQSQYEA